MTNIIAEAVAWAAHVPTVTAVYRGYKWVDGKRTDEVCVVFSVKAKLPLDQIPTNLQIPKSFGDVRTDVIEATYQTLALTDRARPAKGGYSIGHKDISAGTFGMTIPVDNKNLILSNNHVLANSNKAKVGDTILQPGSYDGGTEPHDVIGTLYDFVDVKFPSTSTQGVVGDLFKKLLKWLFGGSPTHPPAPGPAPKNLVDAALCQPTSTSLVTTGIEGIGTLQSRIVLQLGDKVQKIGRTTAHTHGFVAGVDATVQVSYGDNNIATFVDQLIIETDNGTEFSAGGDSGSIIVTEDNHPGGLLFAGSGEQTIANRLEHVLTAFQPTQLSEVL